MYPLDERPTSEFYDQYKAKLAELNELLKHQGLSLEIKPGGRCFVVDRTRKDAPEPDKSHLIAYAEQFNQIDQFLQSLLSGRGGAVRPMTDADHFLHYLEFLNPSLPEQNVSDPLEFFDPEKSIQENCWHSEGRPLDKPDTGFYLGVIFGPIADNSVFSIESFKH